MAELNLGTSLSADDYLDLVTAVNRRRNKSNAMLRGLGALTGVTPTMRSSSGFDTSLRAYSKAKDEEILGKIMGHAADFHFPSENHYRDWYTDKGFPEKMYEASVAEYRKRAGRRESALASQAAQATAEYQQKIRPGQLTRQEQEIDKAKAAEMTKSMSIVAANAARDDIRAIRAGADYDTVVRDRLEESYGWEKANKDYYSSIMAESGLKPGAAVQVYDTEAGELRFMRPTEIAKRNEEAPGTILPPAERPADPTPTSAMKTQMEYRSLLRVGKDTGLTFAQMNEDQQTEAKQNYLSLTHLIKQGQRQNVLLQQITGKPLMKAVKDDITMLVQIEDPEFFQRVFGVPNQYALKRGFEKEVADTEQGFKDAGKKGRGLEAAMDNFIAEWIQEAVNSSGWDEDHIRTMIFPERYAVGK